MAMDKTSFDRDDLLACARGELFGPGNAQLPEPPMLMMDRITDISEDRGLHGKGHVVAEFDITPDLWFFACHFPGNPITPGVILVETAAQAAVAEVERSQAMWAQAQNIWFGLSLGSVLLLAQGPAAAAIREAELPEPPAPPPGTPTVDQSPGAVLGLPK